MKYNKTFKPRISDPTERCDALKAAAQKGNLYARLLYAACFAEGLGHPKNTEKKLKHIQLAADGGLPAAHLIFFQISLLNVNDISDLKLVLHDLDFPVKQGDRDAQVVRGAFHILFDERRAAVRLFKKAAHQKYVLGELSYGICLLFGYGTARNEKNGVEYLARVKKQELDFLVFLSGLALHSVNLHPKTATSYFRFGAKNDIPVAQGYYAWALENGIGVKKNRKRAAEYYKKAVNAGYELARDGLRRCKRSRRS
jgi:TPR repeat protein